MSFGEAAFVELGNDCAGICNVDALMERCTLKIRSRWLTKIAAFCGVAACRLLFKTCRKRFVGTVPEARLETTGDQDDREHFVLCVWHDALLLPTFAAPKRLRKQCCCLVSQHHDGTYLADAMAWMDYTTVRGSSNRGSFEALRQLLSDTKGKHIIFTPDGPCGPRRKLKQGAVFIAAQTGRRLLPGAFVVKRGWRIQGTWTDLLIPMPFTTIYIITGEPISIPAGLPRPELARYVSVAQAAMDQLNDEADQMIGGKSQPSAIQQKAA